MSELWQEKMKGFVGWSEGKLWSKDGAPTVKFLEKLGLDESSLKEARIGWNPETAWRSRVECGLKAEVGANMKPKKLCFPAGIVIPTLDGDEVKRVRVWEYTQKDRPYALAGSALVPLVVGEIEKASGIIVVEEELMAFRITQELGERIAVIALGGAESPPDSSMLDVMKRTGKVVLAVNEKHSWRRIEHIVPNAHGQAAPTFGSDIAPWLRVVIPEAYAAKTPEEKAGQGRARTFWDALAESGCSDQEVHPLEEAIFLFALRKIEGARPEERTAVWSAFAPRWIKILPKEAYERLEETYLGRENVQEVALAV